MSSAFAALGLDAELVRAVTDEGYTEPTPVQSQTIPIILEGRDVLAGAQTGTGKTASFTLPVLQRLRARRGKPLPLTVRALVITPTRELAAQVEESVRTYGRYVQLRSTTIFGGVSMHAQVQALRRGVDLLVATPGRLLDHVQERTIDLSRVEILILDEADRMLDMGFIRDIRKILALLPKERQSLLFSATFSKEIRELAAGFLVNPALVQIAPKQATVDLITQRIHPVEKERKRELLIKLVSEGDWKQVLVFARTKHGANRLAEQIERAGIGAASIHGDKSQPQRTKALAAFKTGHVRVLVATDIAARGIDIEELPHVVNYELPNVPEDYVHRIGRTGRAGSSGEAISLVCAEEHELLADIEKLLGRPVPQEVVAGFEAGAQQLQSASARAQQPSRSRQGNQQPARRDGAGNPGRGNAQHRGNGQRQGDHQHARRGDDQRQRSADGARRGSGNVQPARQSDDQRARHGDDQHKRNGNDARRDNGSDARPHRGDGQTPQRSADSRQRHGDEQHARRGDDQRQRSADDARRGNGGDQRTRHGDDPRKRHNDGQRQGTDARRRDERSPQRRPDATVRTEQHQPALPSAQQAGDASRKPSTFAKLAALFRPAPQR